MIASSVANPDKMPRSSALESRFDGAVARTAWLTGFTLAAAVLFLLNTNQGIGILPDSTRYMRLSPTPYDAPLYTWLLAAMGAAVGRDAGAALIGLVLVCLNTVLIWRLLLKGTDSLAATALGTAVIIFSPQYVGLHAVAMSEPLFLTALFVTILLFLQYRNTRQSFWLVLCSVALALSMLVRFAALPLAATFSVLLLLDRRQPLSARVRDLMILGVIGAAIFFSWVIFSQIGTGHSVGRDMAFNGNTDTELWKGGLNMLTIQLLPSAVPFPLRMAFFLTVAGAIAILIASREQSNSDQRSMADDGVPAIFGLYALFYAAFMFLSLKIEANLNLNGRYALPFYVALAIMATSYAVTRCKVSRLAWAAGQIIFLSSLIIIVSHFARTAQLTREDYQQGIGYASKSWKSSPIVRSVNALPATATIFSNGPDALNYLTPRTTSFTPFRIQRRTGRDNPANSFAHQIEKLRTQMADGNSYVVFLDNVDWRFYLATEAELQKILNLKLVRRESDGRIYAAHW